MLLWFMMQETCLSLNLSLKGDSVLLGGGGGGPNNSNVQDATGHGKAKTRVNLVQIRNTLGVHSATC